MASPAHFEVTYVINPHMADDAGEPRRVDRVLARAQWETLRSAYTALGFDVDVLDAVPGLPDLVFTANPALSFLARDGSLHVILSRMRAPERRPEVDLHETWYRSRGFSIHRLRGGGFFEGMGDVLEAPEGGFRFGGIGPRTSPEALAEAADLLGEPVIALPLVDPRFYHLDTCLCPLDRRRALVHPGAFDAQGLRLLEGVFERLIVPPGGEALEAFACNAHCPDGRHVLIDAEAAGTAERLRAEGFTVIPVPTGEFRKSGGSVFCLKMAVPRPPKA